MRLAVISLCTQGIMREHYIYYCRAFAQENELYCITNSNITNDELNAIETLNLHYNRKNPFGYFSLAKLNKIKKFLDRVNPDIVFVFTHHASSVLIPPIIKKYKVIYQVHDPAPHMGVGRLNAFIIRLQLKIYSKLACRLTVAGQEVKKQVLANCSTVDESKIEVIPFAVLDDFINDDVLPSSEDIDLLFYGRIEPYKGVDVLIEAVEKMKKKPIVYIAGKGDILEMYPNIKRIPDNIKVLGFVDNDTLIGYIKKCKAVVLPYHEATGTMTVCQSFYYGKPVIVSDVGVLPEYTQNGGLIFSHGNADELAEKIETFLSDEKLQQDCSVNARRLYEENFTMNNTNRMHQELFKRILEEN